MRRIVPLLILAALVVGFASSSDGAPASTRSASTFPGRNGKIVYQSYSDSNARLGGIYLIGADGKGDTRLRNQPAESAGPRWSPDGRQIAFFAVGAKTSALFSISPDGKNGRRLFVGTSTEWAAYPAWSPDGKRLVFLRGKPCSTGFCKSHLSILTLKTGKAVDIPHTSGAAYAASWSPDGRTIVFGKTPSFALWLIRPDGSGARRLAAGQNAFPDWSPDGRRIVFTRMVGATSDIYMIRPDGRGLARANKASGDYAGAVWSPDGRKLAFVLNGGKNGDICVLPLAGKERCLTHTAKTDDALPDWQPLPAR
jgi:Tol biopolymer transport system component